MEDATLVKHTKTEFTLRSEDGLAEYPLQGEILVGREVECAIPLDSSHISRYHAKINVSPNGVYVEDLHSTNGTYVNGQKIKGRVRMSVGDEVAFDDILFRLTSNRSGAADRTQISSRAAVSLLSARRSNSPASTKENDDLNELDRIPLPEQKAGKHSEPKPAPPERVSPTEETPSALPRPDIGTERERTVILSPQQIGNMMERNLGEKDVQIGSGPRIVVMTAPIRGKIFSLTTNQQTQSWQIGRDHGSEILLSDSTISSDHARISKSPEGGYLLTATHAKNGVFINGDRVTKARLNHNDKIQIGRTELIFKTDSHGLSPTKPSGAEAIISGIDSYRSSLLTALVVFAVIVTAIIISGN